MGMRSTSPSPMPAVHGDPSPSRRRCVHSQRKRRLRLRISAPGRRPLSHSTWKPLQMPITGTPASAARTTSSMIGEKRAIAPQRR